MFLPFFFREFDNSEDLPKLIERLGPHGDKIIVYRQVYSLILFTITRTVFEVVPNGRSSVIVGLKHAFISLLLGPWSWLGPFTTIHSLMVDLSGGIDVTHLVASRPDGLYVPMESVESDLRCKEKAIQYGFVTILFGILGVLVWKVVIPAYDPTIWSRELIITSLIVIFVTIVIAGVSGRNK